MVIQVLETVTKEEKRKKERLGSVQPNFSLVWHTGLSGGALDSVRWCSRLVRGELAALGIQQQRTAIIHRTVRWCTGWSGGSSEANSLLSRMKKGDAAKIHQTVRWCTGLSGGAPDCPVSQRSPVQRSAAQSTRAHVVAPTVGWEHRTVRCAPDCPVRQPIPWTNGRLFSVWKEIEHRLFLS
jgi:hypothetical protein